MSPDALRSAPGRPPAPGASANAVWTPSARRRAPAERDASALPLRLYRNAQSRELDRLAAERFGLSGARLMQRAGRALYAQLEGLAERCGAERSVSVYCGGGNNGGDGFVVAALAKERGWRVELISVGDPERPARGDAARAKEQAVASGLAPLACADGERAPAGAVVIDALLGSGLRGPPRDAHARAIAHINAAGRPVLSADVPSGLCGDSGRAWGEAVLADCTVSFVAARRGLLTGAGPDCAGQIRFDGLGVPDAAYDEVPADCARLSLELERSRLAWRPRGAHKGTFGRLLVAGGEMGMPGAAALAARAAARAGAGLVHVATRAAHVAAIAAIAPEVLVSGIDNGQDFEPLLARADVVVLGPGLGLGPWGEQLLQRTLASKLPAVLDADALNLLARRERASALENALITPHPGEAARLLGIDVAGVQRDRFAALDALRERYRATTLLKGAGSLIGDRAGVAVCPYGNPGMASAGMGDVLSGIIGALLAQGMEPGAAARLGCCAHAHAADRLAARDGERGLLAGDLPDTCRRLLNGVEPLAGERR